MRSFARADGRGCASLTQVWLDEVPVYPCPLVRHFPARRPSERSRSSRGAHQTSFPSTPSLSAGDLHRFSDAAL